jgi:transcriptional regulator with XRE-family HTH domain
MKLKEYHQQLEMDPEYNEALEELQLKFYFGNAVLRARLKKNWTQAYLAEVVGTKQANISRIESGLANITFSLAQKIINALGIVCRFDQAESQKKQAPEKKSGHTLTRKCDELRVVD